MQHYDRVDSDSVPASTTERELMEEELAAIHGGAGSPTTLGFIPNLASLASIADVLGTNTSGNNSSSANSLPGISGLSSLAQFMGFGGTR